MKFVRVLLVAALLLAPTKKDESKASPSRPFYEPYRASVAALTEVGRRLFQDRRLSARGDLSCSSCHDPRYAYGPPPSLAAGKRAVPSLRYLQRVPRFTLHFMESEDGTDQGPTGGFMWDGRAETAHDQALLPLLSPDEMGNGSRAELAKKLNALPYVQAAFGTISDEDALRASLHALEVFQQSPTEFAPYESAYDDYVKRHIPLGASEERGRKLFEQAGKGNCASCHPSVSRDGGLPAFTDWGFVDIGLTKTDDRGLGGRPEFTNHEELNGLFRAPSLRNVAKRVRFFHDGSKHTLEEVVRFYASKDAKPEAKANLTDAEIGDVVAFLGALTDRR